MSEPGSTAGSGAPRSRWWKRKPRHQHSWSYGPRTVVGWGIVRCLSCGAEDLYS